MARFSLHPRVADGITVLLLFIGVAIFHWRGLQPDYTFLPVDLSTSLLPWRTTPVETLQNWLISDPLYQFYPFLTYTSGEFAKGRFPLWSPDIQLGHPVLADPLFQPFYPVFPLLVLWIGNVARAFSIGLVLHVMGATLGLYALLRTRHHRPLSSAAGAITYGLSGYLVTWFETSFWTSTLSWLPLILLWQEWGFRTGRWRYYALSALTYTIAILAGQLQFALFFAVIWIAYVAGRVIQDYRESGRWQFLTVIASGVAVLAGGIGSSLFLFPFTEFLAISRRSMGNGFSDALAPTQLITLLLPDFFGSPVVSNSYWGTGNYSESTIYAGIIPLVLTIAAPFVTKKFFPCYLMCLLGGILYIAIGGPGVSLLGTIPGLKYLSLHRVVFIVPFLVALLIPYSIEAGKGVTPFFIGISFIMATILGWVVAVNVGMAQSHIGYLTPFLINTFFLLAGFIGICLLYQLLPIGARFDALWHGAVIILIFLDLYVHGANFNPVGPIHSLMPPTALSEALQTETSYRTVALQREGSVLFGANGLLPYGVKDAGGYSSLLMQPYYDLIVQGDPVLDVSWMSRASNMMTFSFPSRRLLDVLQVERLVSHVPLSDGVQVEVAHDSCDSDSGEIRASLPVTGQFTASDTAINRMDIRVRRYESIEANGIVTLRLWQAFATERLVFEQSFNASDLTNEQVLTIYFAPEAITSSHLYRWEMSTPESSTGIGICTDGSGTPAFAVFGVAWNESRVGDYYLYQRTVPLPRAYVVYLAETLPPATVIQRVLDPNFRPRQSVIVENSVAFEPTLAPGTPAVITRYTSTEIDIQAIATQPGLLVLGDTYHPGWHAYVDGLPTEMIRANGVWRGVPLEGGTHTVHFRFEPKSLQWGVLISGSVIGILLLSILLDIHPLRVIRKN